MEKVRNDKRATTQEILSELNVMEDNILKKIPLLTLCIIFSGIIVVIFFFKEGRDNYLLNRTIIFTTVLWLFYIWKKYYGK